MQLQLSRMASLDIQNLLRRSEVNFGEVIRSRYKRLLDQAFTDLLENPLRFGVQAINDVRTGYFSYHLKWSSRRGQRPGIRRPRHLLVFSVSSEMITVAAVVHERELLEHHLGE